MPPKKGGNNGFYYFMLHLKDKHPNLYRNNQQAAEAAGPIWKEMAAEARRPFEERARKSKNNEKVRYTSSGQNVEVLQRQAEEQVRKIQEMKETIENTILTAVEAKTLPDKIFYFIHVNYFCACHKQYIPAEISMAKWTLNTGVTTDNVFSMVCKPGMLPVGYSAEAIRISTETHKIPIPSSSECNLEEVANSIEDFLADVDTRSLPPLYTLNKNAPVVANVLQQLSDAYGIPEYPIFSLEHLFFTLRNCSSQGKVWAAPSLAHFELEKDKYEFCRQITCDFHESAEIPSYCSRSVAIRTVYTVCDNCCLDLYIDLIPGQHVPKNANLVQTRSVSRASSVTSSNMGWEKASRHHQPLQTGYLSYGDTEASEFSETSTIGDPNETSECETDTNEWSVPKQRKRHPFSRESDGQNSSSISDSTQTSGQKLRRPVGLSTALEGISISESKPRGRGKGVAANYTNAKK